MKTNLTLIQPIEYNKLFSSYHNEVKTGKYKHYKLPTITKLFTSTDSKINKVFNNIKLKLKPNKLSHLVNESKNFAYPLLNISIDKRAMPKSNTNLESINYNMDELRNIDKINLIKKVNREQKDNIHQLKMVYLNLFNIKSERKSNSILNFDSFFNSIDNFEMKNNDEDKLLSKKLNEINNKSIIKIINIFNETTFDKLNNDFLTINNIQNFYLNQYSERLLNKYRGNNNVSIDEGKNINSFNKSYDRTNLICNNVFFDWILDNVKHKIELKNEYNQHITNVWIQNLINDEINELKNRFIEFKQSLNLSNYIEIQKKNNSLKNQLLIKKDDSFFTESTYRTNFNISKRKNSLNNNSNIISNYNSSFQYDDNFKMKLKNNQTINEINNGFDFFTEKSKRVRTIKPINTKHISNFVFKKNIKFNAIKNKSNHNLNKSNIINLKNSLVKSKNKTELNNEYHGQNTNLFKNLYTNNPRSNKIKNFKLKLPDNINSKMPINNEFNNISISPSKKNFDIMEKLNNKSNNISTINNITSEIDNSFILIEKAKSRFKKRNSVNFTPIQFTSFQALKIQIPNNTNESRDSKENTKRKNKKLKKRGSEISKLPRFKNNIVYKNIVKSIYQDGKYKPKYEEGSDSSNSSDDSDDSFENDYSDENEINNEINGSDFKNKKRKRKNKRNNNQNETNSKQDTKRKNKKAKKKDKIAIKNAKIKEKNEQELESKLEKNDLIKNLNQNLISKKGKRNKYSNEDINEFKKIFTKKKKYKNEIIKGKENIKTKKKKNARKSLKSNINDRDEEDKESEDEAEEKTIYSISSNHNEDEDINENLEIKNEVDIMNILLSNNESKNVFNSMFELKKYLRKKNKVEEDKEIIKENKNQIKAAVNKYFETLVSKLSNNHIKNENIHLNVLNELELIQKYGVFTFKDLKKLVKRAMEQRYDDSDDEKRYNYNRFYYYNEYDEYFGTGKKEKKYKIMKKSASAEVKMKKNAFKKFVRVKYDKIKSKFKQPKKNLIYNNSYLFKDNHSDNDEQNKLIVKKEIQEILDKEYNEIIKRKKEEIFREKKRKEREVFLQKKTPFKKKEQKRQIMRLVDEPINEVLLNKKKIDKEVDRKQLEKEKEIDKKMYEFFSKIQKLKKRRDSYDEEKLNKFIDQEIDKTIKSRQKQRLYYFLEEFNLNRIRAKNVNVNNNKRLGFLSPIIFTSPNENNSSTNFGNYK